MSKQKPTPQTISDFRRPAAPQVATKNSSALKTIAWFGMLFVIASIAFSTYMVYFGSDNFAAKVMLIPQVVFATGVAIYKFAFSK